MKVFLYMISFLFFLNGQSTQVAAKNLLIEMPITQELFLVFYSLTDLGQTDEKLIARDSEYYKLVQRDFAPFKDHPLVVKFNEYVNSLSKAEAYYMYNSMRMNACMYGLNASNKIFVRTDKKFYSFKKDIKYRQLLTSLQPFAQDVDFYSFYIKHKPFYKKIVTNYKEEIPVGTMIKWLEREFSSTYDSYQIYFSPLIGGYHSTQKVKIKDKYKTLMFIGAPRDSSRSIFTESYVLRNSRMLFTEIDHNYVNPVSDQHWQVNKVMHDIGCWNHNAQGHISSYLTFNEYMTWALFRFYLMDYYDDKTSEMIWEETVNYMVHDRGFIKFREFDAFTISLRNHGKKVEEMYPVILKWVDDYACGAAVDE